VGAVFRKRGRDRKDFAQGATEAAGGSPPDRPDEVPMVILQVQSGRLAWQLCWHTSRGSFVFEKSTHGRA
jgi:hypothetical protein